MGFASLYPSYEVDRIIFMHDVSDFLR